MPLMLIINPAISNDMPFYRSTGHYGERYKTLTRRLIRALSIVTSAMKRASERAHERRKTLVKKPTEKGCEIARGTIDISRVRIREDDNEREYSSDGHLDSARLYKLTTYFRRPEPSVSAEFAAPRLHRSAGNTGERERVKGPGKLYHIHSGR